MTGELPTMPAPRTARAAASRPGAAEVSSEEAGFLDALGARVRALRELRGLSRRALAGKADVSERYLAQLESGIGNVSVLLLRRITAALDTGMAEIFNGGATDPVEHRLVKRLLDQVPAHRLEDLVLRLSRELGREVAERRRRIALIGMRGAGKTTLGRRLAGQLGVPFVEINELIEREAGLPLAEVFALYGQNGYRRLERRCLERLLEETPRAVISVGGGIVTDDAAYRLLLDACQTVWLRATPEDHMARVLAQGDLRPMSGNAEAMEELKTMLDAREPLYRRADVSINTTGQSPEQSLERLRELLEV